MERGLEWNEGGGWGGELVSIGDHVRQVREAGTSSLNTMAGSPSSEPSEVCHTPRVAWPGPSMQGIWLPAASGPN